MCSVLSLSTLAPILAQSAPCRPASTARAATQARFARSHEDLCKVQRLRFEVFNLELREGLAESYATGLDSDDFDLSCHHLMVLDQLSGDVVGTYRLMTHELAARDELYTASEFDLSQLPEHVFRHGAEVGRACVGKEHRNGRVLQLLWRGIARYLDWNDKRYVFGCCSIPTLDVGEIAGISLKLAREGHMHPRYLAKVSSELRVDFAGTVVALETSALPPLFTSYLRLGAKVCGGPALDRAVWCDRLLRRARPARCRATRAGQLVCTWLVANGCVRKVVARVMLSA